MSARKPLLCSLCFALVFSSQPARAEDAKAKPAAPTFEQNTISGSTGLLRLSEPRSDAAGTFRISLLGDWYSGSGFLCNQNTPCGANSHDSADHFGTTLGLSVTPLPYLEAYASLRSFVNSDDQHSPGLLSVLDNTTLGGKLFTASAIGGLLSLGGAAELDLLNGSGSVGIDGKGTSFRLAALAGLDLSQLQGGAIPLRITTNLGYFFDNSGNLVSGVEQSRGAPITRVERFGLGINRVDRFQAGLGVEARFDYVRPFAEWNLEVPVNRQNYNCATETLYSGDQCLQKDGSLSAFPSTLTLGARVLPGLAGFSATAALDIGTSGTSNFIQELAPTLPWDLWLGVGYGFDITPAAPPPPAAKPVVPPPPVVAKPLRARGLVHETGKTDGIANAIVRYQGRELTAMATGTDGRFISDALEPGTYTLEVEADGYKPGQCSVVITSTPPQADYFDVDCELEALPRAGNVLGTVVDLDTNTPLDSASVELTDPLGRSLKLTTDSGGTFRFERVLPGTVTIRADATDHLFHSQTLDVHVREDAHATVGLHKRPKVSLVEVAGNEVKIKQQIHFDQDSATILGDSNALLEEIADTLAHTPRITRLEIQGHTDNSGSAEHNKSLSEARANAVLDSLTAHGVDPNRLTARGYGQEHPIAPNASPQGRAKNRRVQFIILEQGAGP